jgi:hypothetical protein
MIFSPMSHTTASAALSQNDDVFRISVLEMLYTLTQFYTVIGDVI